MVLIIIGFLKNLVLYYLLYSFVSETLTTSTSTDGNQWTTAIATEARVRADEKRATRVMLGSYVWFRMSLHTLLPVSSSFLFYSHHRSFSFFFFLYVAQHIYLISRRTLTCLQCNYHIIPATLKKKTKYSFLKINLWTEIFSLYFKRMKAFISYKDACLLLLPFSKW